MLKSKVGYSTNSNAYTSSKEALLMASEGLTNPKLVFMYSSVVYDQQELLKATSDLLPDVPIIGCTSFTGVLTPDGYISGDDGFIGMMALADDALSVGIAGLPKTGDARLIGREVAKKALKHANRSDAPKYFYMVASPGEEESYLKGIQDIIGRVPFFGGSAADNSISGEWSLFTHEGAFADGVAVAFFYTDKAFANEFTGAYKESNHVGVITKVDGKRGLIEIDGKPAVKVYADWTGTEADSLLGANLLAATITAPLGVKDRLGDLVAIRHPMSGNPDYSMSIGNNVAENTAVIMMEATVDDLIDSSYTTLEKLKSKLDKEIGAYHIVHCGGRRAGIGDRIDEVAENLKKAAGDVPFLGVFTFGEYGFEDDGNNTCGGLMLSFSAFEK